MKTLKIGKLKLKNPLVLAPMVDVTDLPFRLLCRRAGAALAFTEMIYVDALLHENAPTLRMVKTCKEDSPLGLQITGNDVKEFEEFVKRKNLWKDFDLIDLNCGCPSTRIIGTCAGSFLLKDPVKISEIIRVLKKTGKPVTAKIRLGYLKNNVLEIARMVEKAGADALTVHARLSNDPYAKKADWSWFARVKKEVGIPVIGNGDVFTGKDAGEVLKICDGVMIARAAIGDPLVFARVLDYLESERGRLNRADRPTFQRPDHPPQIGPRSYAHRRGKYVTNLPEPLGGGKKIGSEGFGGAVGFPDLEFDWRENLKQFSEYLKLEKKYFGEVADFGKIKYVGGKFLRGFAGASQKRDEFTKLKNWDEIEEFVETLK